MSKCSTGVSFKRRSRPQNDELGGRDSLWRDVQVRDRVSIRAELWRASVRSGNLFIHPRLQCLPLFSLSHSFWTEPWCNPTRPRASLAHHAALSMSQWGNYENINFMTWNEKGHVVWIDVQRWWKWCNFLNSVIMVMCNGNAYLLSKISLSARIVELCACIYVPRAKTQLSWMPKK